MPAKNDKRVVVLQSNYLPWKGYFDLIRKADLLVFYDDTQYTKNDWRNRNRIKTPRGPEWITVPCGGHIHRLIVDVCPSDSRWQRSHWDRLVQNYRSAPYFRMYRSFFEDFYLDHTWPNLSAMNQYLVRTIAHEFLDIHTPVKQSTDFSLTGTKEERLVDLLLKARATTYLSGPTGKSFLRLAPFERSGIKVEWMNYTGYATYNQLYPPFVHEVSIIDLLFSEGPFAKDYLGPVGTVVRKEEAETVSLFSKF